MKDELDVGEVWKKSFSIILHNLIILVPILIVIVFEQLLGILLRSFIVLPSRITSIKDLMSLLPSLLPVLFISFVLVYIIAYPIFGGMLTLMVKNILEDKKIEPKAALRSALKKAPTLIAASFIVDLLFLAGILFFIIPGVIIGIWYFYTIPAIMLENRGVLDGMKASKSFASDKKFKTLQLCIIALLFLTIANFFVKFISLLLLLVFGITSLSGGVLSGPTILLIGIVRMLNLAPHLIYFTWTSVIITYAYIKWTGLKTTSESSTSLIRE